MLINRISKTKIFFFNFNQMPYKQNAIVYPNFQFLFTNLIFYIRIHNHMFQTNNYFQLI